MSHKKRYRVERWNEPLERWDFIVGSEDNKSYAYGFAHGMQSFYPCPKLRITESEGSGWRNYEEFKANGSIKLA